MAEKELIEIFAEFNRYCSVNFGGLPSSPPQSIALLDRPPQPRIDANVYGGMAALIGRIERADVFGSHGLQYQVLSNNVQKGAAKGMVQVAEHLYSIGFIPEKFP